MYVCARPHLQQQFQRVVVFDPALAAGHSSQVCEPDAGDPVFVVRGVETLKLLPLLSRHEAWNKHKDRIQNKSHIRLIF